MIQIGIIAARNSRLSMQGDPCQTKSLLIVKSSLTSLKQPCHNQSWVQIFCHQWPGKLSAGWDLSEGLSFIWEFWFLTETISNITQKQYSELTDWYSVITIKVEIVQFRIFGWYQYFWTVPRFWVQWCSGVQWLASSPYFLETWKLANAFGAVASTQISFVSWTRGSWRYTEFSDLE